MTAPIQMPLPRLSVIAPTAAPIPTPRTEPMPTQLDDSFFSPLRGSVNFPLESTGSTL